MSESALTDPTQPAHPTDPPDPPDLCHFVVRDAEARDCESIVGLIKELAQYEGMSGQVEMDARRLEEDGFGEGHSPRFRALVCECAAGVVAYCLFVHKYSTWKGPFAWVEDLYVKPHFRRLGLGEALLRKVVSRAAALGLARVEWNVLAWNQVAISFYRKLGAIDLTAEQHWHVFRLSEQHFQALLERPQPNSARISTV